MPKILTGGWLFPSLNPMDPLTTRQLNRVVYAAAALACGMWAVGVCTTEPPV